MQSSTQNQQPSFGIINNPISVSSNLLKEGMNCPESIRLVANSIHDVERCETTEQVVLTILSMLTIDKVTSTPKNSTLDAIHKVDFVVKIQKRQLGFQIKSSLIGAEKHSIKSEVGVVWCNSKCDMIQLLEAMSMWLKVPIRQEVIRALDKFNLMKSMGIKDPSDSRLKLLRITNIDVGWLMKLKLVRVERRIYVYK